MSKKIELIEYINNMLDSPNTTNAQAHASALTMHGLVLLARKLGYDVMVEENENGIPRISMDAKVIDYMKDNKDK